MKIFCDNADYKNFLTYKKDKIIKGFYIDAKKVDLEFNFQ